MRELYYVDAYRFKPLKASRKNALTLEEALDKVDRWRKAARGRSQPGGSSSATYNLTTDLVLTPGIQLHVKRMYECIDDPHAEYVTLPDLRTLLPESLAHYASFFRLLQKAKNHEVEHCEIVKPHSTFINSYRYDSRYAAEVSRMYEKCFHVPLVTSSLFNQQKGKKNICRQSLSKKRGYVSRGTLVTSPSASPDTVFLHRDVYELLERPQSVLVKRDPSLKPEAFFKAKCDVWQEHAVGCHPATYKGSNADNDGDMALVLAYHEPQSLAQIGKSLKPYRSCTMGDYGTRWVPPVDANLYAYVATRHHQSYPQLAKAFRKCFPPTFCSPLPDSVKITHEAVVCKRWKNNLLQACLLSVRDVLGGRAYCKAFENVVAFYERASLDTVAMSVCWEEVEEYSSWQCSNSDEFERRLMQFDEPAHYFMAIAVKSGVLDSAEHIYHACKIYLPGVNLQQYLKTAEDGIVNCMKSKELGKAGHAAIQAAATLQSVRRCSRGNVVKSADGTTIFDDVSQYMPPCSVLPPASVAAAANSLLL